MVLSGATLPFASREKTLIESLFVLVMKISSWIRSRATPTDVPVRSRVLR
jgi:hypothetical protein